MIDNKEHYLGERIQTEVQTEIKKADLQISYGGDIPQVFNNEEYVPLTNAEIEAKRVLSEMYEKKNMINRRMLYLENKRMELLSYYMNIKQRNKDNGLSGLTFRIIPIAVLMIMIIHTLYRNTFILVISIILMICLLILIVKYRKRDTVKALKDLDIKIDDMEKEHKKLEAERKSLLENIEEYKSKKQI